MRIIIPLIFISFLLSCFPREERSTNYHPVFINYANQVLDEEFGYAVHENEKVSYLGRKITRGDSTVSELEIVIKNSENVPFEDELPRIGQKIATAVKTVLVDTNQYEQYKISYFRKKKNIDDAGENTAHIIIYAKDVESIPLNSPNFKPGMLKR